MGRALAEKTLADMEAAGLVLKSLTLTAKDKLCFCRNGTLEDTPELDCPYTKGYYDRLPQGLSELFNHHRFTRSLIETLAEKHQLCPFEYSLDLTLWLDVIIGDYNHVFHPSAALKRIQEDRKRRKTLLIDEAHNLLDRARDMFTVTLSKRQVLHLHRALKPHDAFLAKRLYHLNRAFLSLKADCEDEDFEDIVKREEDCYLSLAKPDLEIELLGFCDAVEQWMADERQVAFEKEVRDALVDFYFESRQFLRILELYNRQFITLIKFFSYGKSREMEVTLYCLDPAGQLSQAYATTHAVVFFSATLAPFPYYARALGLEEERQELALPSPFPPGKLRGLHRFTHQNHLPPA